MKYLDEALYEYSQTDFYPFHMPGHKRNFLPDTMKNFYDIDITEITNFDNLHHAEGILKENQQLAASLYGADFTYFLINGSTAGILAAVSACTKRNGKLLMVRNCHKAVYHAAYLRGLKTTYLYPSYEPTCGLNGRILPADVEKALEKDRDIQAVLITSPTYEGIVSDVKSIAEIVHKYNISLIVDEAHGAHFSFHDGFPVSALDLGADVVIHSLHKTLPSPTQTALLHVKGKRIDINKVETFLGIYQTSSPSYVLMGGISACLRFIKEKGEEAFEEYVDNLKEYRLQLSKIKSLRMLEQELGNTYSAFDISKLVISTVGTGISGVKLHDILRGKYHLEMEMEAENYVIALTGVLDNKEGFERLTQAFLEIDAGLSRSFEPKFCFEDSSKVFRAEQACPIYEGMEGKKQRVLFSESEGLISGEYAYLYPPGIPLLTPGEKIDRQFLEQALKWKKQGLYLQGLQDYTQEFIWVLDR